MKYFLLGLILCTLTACPFVAAWKAGTPLHFDTGWQGRWVPDSTALKQAEPLYMANIRIRRVNEHELRLVATRNLKQGSFENTEYRAALRLLEKDTLLLLTPVKNNPAKLHLYYRVKRTPVFCQLQELESSAIPDTLHSDTAFLAWYTGHHRQKNLWGPELRYLQQPVQPKPGAN